ncbi:MAG: DUF1553 domain-containing protein [Planctomycetaceae bacterium]|nr:DUF1553 domain-containing protein [Planctomycetaceae bacterium]
MHRILWMLCAILSASVCAAGDSSRPTPTPPDDEAHSPEGIAAAREHDGEADTHWAFRPLSEADPPSIAIEGWSDHPIDRFIASQWQAKGVTPVEQVEPGMLLRRVTFDLIGLPPSPHEMREFEAASRVDPEAAYQDLIERLLASPQYGERWGRHWMDVVRYADTAGDNADYPIPEAHLYRDYIIDAFNADLPYDRFVREQLAGDLLAKEQPGDRFQEQIVATGFVALSRRYATGPYELWHLTLEDTIDTVGRAFLGLTLKCARCHDHKFDPVTTEDYYALYGIFDSTQFPWAGAEELHSKKTPRMHFASLLSDEAEAPLRTAFEQKLAEIERQKTELEDRAATSAEAERDELNKQIGEIEQQLVQLRRRGLPDGVPGAYAVQDREAHDANVQYAGDPSQPGDEVPRGAIAFLSEESLAIPSEQSGRLQLADWVTRQNQALIARVMINRIWQHHFGRGLVTTPSNFGLSGSEPSHPELLDFLAREFIDNGWSIKQMHRLILTSHVWRLSSQHDESNAAIDPGNTLLWRHDRRRLDAEAIRDAMLSVGGTLDLTRPGEHPFPPMKEWTYTQHSQFKDRYESSHRSVYLMTQRIQKHPFLALFDGPDTNTTTAMRTSSLVTPQSLYLMNSPEMSTLARDLATRLMTESESDNERIVRAYELCFARTPTSAEVERTTAAISELVESLEGTDVADDEREREAWTSLARVMLSSSEFFYID